MLKKARVVATHPKSHAVDLVMMDDGRRYSGVQVAAGVAGGNVGNVDLPEPTVTDKARPYESRNTGDRDIFALVAFAGEIPFVMGFVYPQVSQMLFDGDAGRNRKIYRHASDVYFTIDEAGNTELHHPSGTYLRIGESTDHDDLAGLDYDKTWKQSKNTDKAVGIAIEVHGGGEKKLSLRIDPEGNMVFSSLGNINITIDQDATIKSNKITLDTPTVDITGDVSVGGDVVASGISLVHHKHPDPQGGQVSEPV
jgi:hypothetical protein